VLANSCGANQVQNFFQVTNTGSTAVPLSAIQIKFWPDDTTGQKVVPQVSFGGCVSDAGNSTCVHQVTGVTAAPTSFSACGTGPQKQANWEITVSNTDKTLLPPGATWSNIQSQVHLTNFGNFSPGAANWYSSCVSGGIARTGGTSASAPLWAAFTALINQANGVGGPSSTSPIGFLNPALYHFAATTPSAFNDIADGSNNNWFDDGQKIEGSSDGAGIPLPPTAETVSTSKPPVNTFSALPGAPLAGTSESPGLYHAVAGYDLVTGLGTPTCNLLAALAPSLAIPPPPPPPPPPHVIIKYSQLNEACTFYSDSLDPGAIASAGSGNAYVFFGITGIENDGNAPFSVDLANLFVPPGVFASPIGSDLELSLYAPFAEDTSVVVPANFDLEYQADAFVGFAVLPRISDTTVASFFLNYSLNPSDPSVTNPQVTFIRTNNPAVTSFSISDPCSL
jgi:hypothetical protein